MLKERLDCSLLCFYEKFNQKIVDKCVISEVKSLREDQTQREKNEKSANDKIQDLSRRNQLLKDEVDSLKGEMIKMKKMIMAIQGQK